MYNDVEMNCYNKNSRNAEPFKSKILNRCFLRSVSGVGSQKNFKKKYS